MDASRANDPPRSSRSRTRLLALNLVLLAALGGVTLASRAQQPAVRGRGDYSMVSGRIQGGQGNAIYILDGANQQLVALRWSESRKSLDGLDYRDLARDAGSNAGVAR